MAGTFILIMTAAFYATAEYKGGLPVLPVGIRYAAERNAKFVLVAEKEGVKRL